MEETRSTVAASELGSAGFAFAGLSEVGRASGRRSRAAGYESAAACATEAIESAGTAGRSAATGMAADSNDGTSRTSRERAGAGPARLAAGMRKTTPDRHTHQMEATKVVSDDDPTTKHAKAFQRARRVPDQAGARREARRPSWGISAPGAELPRTKAAAGAAARTASIGLAIP